MDIKGIIEEFDAKIAANDRAGAEQCLRVAIEQIEQTEDPASLAGRLVLYNEMAGFLRENGDASESADYADKAVELSRQIPTDERNYATTLINAGNANRAAKRLQESRLYYDEARAVMERMEMAGTLDTEDMLIASLCNNEALLYQELGDYEHTKELLLVALSVAHANDEVYEGIVTLVNLNATAMALGEEEEAERYRETAYALAKRLSDSSSSYLENMLTRQIGGLALCAEYWDEIGAPAIMPIIVSLPPHCVSVGLCGEGSDCLGIDDRYSRDHDWGPGFAIYIDDEYYDMAAPLMASAYEQLPKEFLGYERSCTPEGACRVGVCRTSDYYARILGSDHIQNITGDFNAETDIDWTAVNDWSLRVAVSGAVWTGDEDTVFMRVRKALQNGYPASIRYARMAEAAARCSQSLLYNVPRAVSRGDRTARLLALSEGIRQGYRLVYLAYGEYPPIDKHLRAMLLRNAKNAEIVSLADSLIEAQDDAFIATYGAWSQALSDLLYEQGLITYREPALIDAVPELARKAEIVSMCPDDDSLIDSIVAKEFDAFDRVQNVGGRADCQDDWQTFKIMRTSQYRTWPREMLVQYRYEFEAAIKSGRNLITEKYARMMQSNYPEEYEAIKDKLSEIPDSKMAVINAITAVQVSQMEAFAESYPRLAVQARPIHTSEDAVGVTSYETYLRGELCTYSDQLLGMYGAFVAGAARLGRNLASETMENTAKMYGYESLEAAEQALCADGSSTSEERG